MSLEDYSEVLALWQQTEGIGLNESDSESAIADFLARNPGMCVVALSSSGAIIGAVLCGHDGRRGYLHHLAVERAYRKQGVANALISRCFDRLAEHGIMKCNVFLLRHNESGASFWLHNGWSSRTDLQVLQKAVDIR